MRSRGTPKLPAQQLAILAICRFAEPVALTSVFPYLPEMIESFGVEKKDVAQWAGITSAVFSLSQCVTAIIWGRASDRFGRKPAILTALTCTMFSTLFWGMSTSLPMAMLARAIAGGCNGNGFSRVIWLSKAFVPSGGGILLACIPAFAVGVIRTTVAEMVPQKELQPRAFSIMPLVWSLGSIFGPTFGGFFAKPAENYPGLFGHSKFLIKYPFALPNIAASGLFLTGITVGVLFLKETLETKKHKTDYGRELGKSLVSTFKVIFRLRPKPEPFRQTLSTCDDPSAPLLRRTSIAISDVSTSLDDDAFRSKDSQQEPPQPGPTFSEVFTRQSVINLMSYTFLALHAVSYDQLLPIFMHHPRQTPDSTNTSLPFKFSGGFGLGASRIGTLFTMYGIIGCFIQFLIFPPVARKFGVLNCFKCCAVTFPVICFITPYTALIQSSSLQQATMFCIMIVKSFAVIFAFPCAIILLTNSAVSLRILGTLNGVAVSVSAIGRAVGPAIGGVAFTWGLEKGYMITAWWLLGILAAIGAIPIWYLVEMDGFDKSDSDLSEDEHEDLLGPVDESVHGEMLQGDEILTRDVDEEVLDVVDGPPLARISSKKSWTGSEAGNSSRLGGSFESRMSNPIGLREPVGPGGRRLSNGLAASNFGQGTGGTSFN